MTDLENECIRRIAEAKAIPEDTITLDATLESLAVDSLDRVTLSFDLEEEYGVVIPEAKLHAIQTVQDVVDAVQQALTQKNSAETSGQPTP